VGEKIAIGSDHRGFAIKEALKAVLETLGKTVEDKGAFSTASVDYPEFARQVAKSVSAGECSRGILICGSGIGMSVTANKFPGVRAALCHDMHTVKMCRQHNDANILVLGEAVGRDLAQEMLKVWFETPFEGGRHQKRLDLIRIIEKENFKEAV
jgi:ribose 5-phosphate isomerase B